MSYELILASASPRRAELLTSAGFSFRVQPAAVDETPHPGEDARSYVLRVGREKARNVAATCSKSGSVVLAADTTVVANGEILGKPADRNTAIHMLEVLSGVTHEVLTAVVVVADGMEHADVSLTRVRLFPLTPAEIAWYVDSGEPEGKAGGYAIQGRAARFVDWIEGSWSNVVGLPVATVYQLLKRAGVEYS